ncbi:hypothetical protein IWW50_000160 [Coemansia erecta]|nr:hypothetical protein IWW50_000160 [Coemansia erecta]
MHTIQLTSLVVAAASVVAGEMYFNVPAGVDQGAVKEAFMERGIQGYNPVARVNAEGLIPAMNTAGRPQSAMMEGTAPQQQQPQGPLPQQQPQRPQQQQQPQAPPQKPQQQPQALPQQQPQQPQQMQQQQQLGKPAAIPLAAAHGPGGVGLQSAADAEFKPEANDIKPEIKPEVKPEIKPEIKASSTELKQLAAPQTAINEQPHNAVVSTVVAVTTVTGVAPLAKTNAAAPARVTAEDEEEVVEEEEFEDDDDASDASTTAAAGAATSKPAAMTQPAIMTQPAGMPQPAIAPVSRVAETVSHEADEKPLVLAKAAATAFKPADLDKFTFPSSEATVNLAGPAAASSSPAAPASVHSSTMRAAPASSSASAHSSEASKMPKANSLSVGNGVLSKSAHNNSADSADSAAPANAASSLVALAVMALLF